MPSSRALHGEHHLRVHRPADQRDHVVLAHVGGDGRVVHAHQQVAVQNAGAGGRLIRHGREPEAGLILDDVGADAAKTAAQIVLFQLARLRLDEKVYEVAVRLDQAAHRAVARWSVSLGFSP
ncbi:MAG: hypothetical protein R2851_28105 [Caldilineaceae bacterium]